MNFKYIILPTAVPVYGHQGYVGGYCDRYDQRFGRTATFFLKALNLYEIKIVIFASRREFKILLIFGSEAILNMCHVAYTQRDEE
jgi:hypothetical protein